MLRLVFGAGLIVLGFGKADLASAAEAPPFQLPAADQRSIALGDLRGKVVYVDFWASWCVPCLKSFPWMSEMQRKYGAGGLEVVAINLDKNPADARKFLDRVPHDFTILYDPQGATARSYGLRGMPSSYVVARDGAMRLAHAGFREADREVLEAAIRSALEAK